MDGWKLSIGVDVNGCLSTCEPLQGVAAFSHLICNLYRNQMNSWNGGMDGKCMLGRSVFTVLLGQIICKGVGRTVFAS